MVEFWIIIAILCLIAITGGSILFLRRFAHSLDEAREEREAWQQAQEGRQRTWEVRQGKHILETEKKLAEQLKDARREWRGWQAQIQQDHQEWRAEVDLEKELARLPLVEQLELAPQGINGRVKPETWQPAALYKTDLRGRDLSYRYMERADLREAQLVETNFCMTDLTGASLAGANLQQANLLGANLSGVDLRGASLVGADLMVADLHNAVLHGADLRGARNLTAEQLQHAIYDSTTSIDSAIDITLPRIPSVVSSIPRPTLQTSAPTESVFTPNTTEQPADLETPVLVNPLEQASGLQEASSVPETIEQQVAPIPQEDVVQEPAIASQAETASPTASSALSEQAAAPTTVTKKTSTSRKRAGKTRQIPTPAQSFLNQARENSVEEESQRSDTSEEFAHSSKIIQWPTRASKTAPLPAANEQHKGDKASTSRANNQAALFNEASEESPDQQAQAN